MRPRPLPARPAGLITRRRLAAALALAPALGLHGGRAAATAGAPPPGPPSAPPAGSAAAPLAGPAVVAAPAPLDASLLRPWAREIVDRLSRAADDGLDPADYGVEALQAALQRPRPVPPAPPAPSAPASTPAPPAPRSPPDRLPAPDAAARLDAALLAALLRYLSDLRVGRVRPQQLKQAYRVPAGSGFDPEATLQAALAAGSLASAWRAATPPLPLYGALRDALATCRALGAHPAWQQALPPVPKSLLSSLSRPLPQRTAAPSYSAMAPPGPATAPATAAASAPATATALARPTAPASPPASPPASARGSAPGLPPAPAPAPAPAAAWAGAHLLAQRLVAWGDLAAVPQPAPTTLDDTLTAGLRNFQRRHGLQDDGVPGRATLAALEVTPAQRAQQITLMLERLRWTPLLQAPRMIVVNLPEFILRAYEVQPDGRVAVREQMKVIIGRALDTRTPQFDELMRHVEFSPYWNVPASIARRELVPRLRRDPGHFARGGFEFVDGSGRVLAETSPARLDAVLAGTLRIRQRPGERNALGDVKFVFPNRDSIYLHHTPTTGLFARDRRDFSHGCVRVEQPVALARFVLQDEPGWTEARIRAAMAAGKSTTQRLSRPLPVLISYGTALVKEGRLHFFDDLYGHDRVLQTALQQRRRPPLPTP